VTITLVTITLVSVTTMSVATMSVATVSVTAMSVATVSVTTVSVTTVSVTEPITVTRSVPVTVMTAILPHPVPVPIMSVPVTTVFPRPPVAVEVPVVYPVIACSYVKTIVERYTHHDSRDKGKVDIIPRSVVNAGAVPTTLVGSIPVVVIEIETGSVRRHIDVACSAGNYHYVRRCGEYQRRERNANAYVHLGFARERHADNEKQRNYEQHNLPHKPLPPFG
jgi:hypothetical protein